MQSTEFGPEIQETRKKWWFTIAAIALVLIAAALILIARWFYTPSEGADGRDALFSEAVAMAGRLQVFPEAGSAGSNEILSREDAAHVVVCLALTRDEADRLVASKAPYDDVARDRPRAGCITYAKNDGYLSGLIKDNAFRPEDGINGMEFTRMLLLLLGYDAEQEGLDGPLWYKNTYQLAEEAGITCGYSPAELLAPVDHRTASLLVRSALTADVGEDTSEP